ncbi:MAG TPA: ornithine cyclodeaminase family protein [Microscillaceae bacterium]|nr:ornithine cyclodeaminase family protein [Microscillaceae bacterium]
MNIELRVLSRQDVKQALPMQEAIAAMRASFTLLYQQKAQLPARMEMPLAEDNADLLFMPSYVSEYHQAGLKIANVFRNNPAKGLPLIQGLMLLIDTQTGQPCALMDSTYLTALRTAAGSALATDLLANKEAKTLALFGTGANTITHLEAMNEIRALEKVWIYGRTLAKAQAFVQEYQSHYSMPLMATDDLGKLAQAHLICTTTSAENPLFETQQIAPGTHITAIGSYKPHWREVPGKLVAESKIVVDSREACLSEAGDILLPIQEGLMSEQHILGELGEVIVKQMKVRTSTEDITFYKSVGVGVQDLTAAHYIYQKAQRLGLGQLMNI